MSQLSKNNTDSLQIWLKELKEFQLDSMFDTNVLGRAFLYIDSITIQSSSENEVKALVDNGKYMMTLASIDGIA